MGAFRTLDDIGDLRGKRVLIRVDLNVPMADGKVSDDTRIRASAPTIREVADKGGKAILLAHFGRPKDGPDPQFSLRPVVPAVAAVLGRPVAFAGDCTGAEAE
jgi:phosphoglycerate kinase